MNRTRTSFLAFALLALGAGCDALIGLGDEPSGAAPTSTSTGEPASSSTGATTTGDASSSSGGGDDASSTSSAGGSGGAGTGGAGVATSTGAGGSGGEGGAGGAGGEGGGAPDPCGPCDEGLGCDACDASETRCIRRLHTPIAVWAAGNDIGSDVNRLGRGLAVTPEVVAFWALSAQDTPAVFVLDRTTQDWTVVPIPPPGEGSKPFYAIGAVPGTGRVLVLDNGGGMLELTFDGDGWMLQPEDAYGLPDVGVFGGALQGLHLVALDGTSHKFDPTEPPAIDNPCRVSNASVAAAPIDARVELLGGELKALSIGYGGVVTSGDGTTSLLPIHVGRGGFGCATDDFVVTAVPRLHWGLAITAFGNSIFAKGATTMAGTEPMVVELTAAGTPTGQERASNRSRALEVRASGALVPLAGGGLDLCTGFDDGSCSSALDASLVGDVKELVGRPEGYFALGFEGAVDDTGSFGAAIVACVDER